PRSQGTFLGALTSFGVRLALFYTLFAALWSCSKQPFTFKFNPRDNSQVCRTLAQSKAALEPHYQAAWKDVEPWISPYVEPVAPYYRSAVRFSSPHVKAANKRGHLLWKAHGEPVTKRLVKQAHTFAAPHIKTARGHYKKSVKPHVDTAQATIKPYQDIYARDVHPYVLEAQVLSARLFHQSLRTYQNDVHPRLLSALAVTHRTYVTHVDPAIRRGYSVWVRPQVEKVLARLFQRKAHAVGTEAIDQASVRAKDARSEGQVKASQAVEAAQASARRAQEDPTIMDRLNKAKDAISGKKPSHEDPIQAAALDAELDAELATVKKELEAWEDGMLKLIEKEYGLVTERLAELRNGRLADLPDRFASLTESFVEDEVATALSKLERSFRKISNDQTIERVAERVEKARAETEVQKDRLSASRAALEASLNAYAGELEADEESSIHASVAEVKRFSDEATKFFVKTMEKAKFTATEEEWEGWASGLSVRAEMYEEELEAVRIGERNVRSGINATDLAKEPQIPPRIADLRKSATSLYASAIKELDRFALSAEAQLRGEGVQTSVGEATEAVAERAQQLSEQAAAAMLGAAAAARARLGLAPKDDGILARVSAKAGEMADAAASQAADAAEQVRTVARSAASAAGATPSPEGVREHAESLFGVATDQAAYVQDVVAEKAASASAEYLATKREPLAESLFNAATSSVGEAYEKLASQAKEATAAFQPSSTGYAESLFNAATSSVGEAYERAASAAFEPEQTPVHRQVFDSASRVAEGAAAVAGEYLANAGEAAGSAQDAAISQLHSATRSAASAAGYKPTPETPGEYVEHVFDGASSAYADAVDAAAQAYSNAQEFANRAGEEAISRLHTASRSAASAVGATPSPENAADYAEKIFEGASKAYEDAGSAAFKYYADASGAAGEAQEAAISALHSATRSAASAAGYKPTPETASEYLENAKDALFAGAKAGREAVAGVVPGSGSEPEVPAVEAKQVDEDFNHVGKLFKGGVDSIKSAAAPMVEGASSILAEGSESAASVASPYASGAADALSEASKSAGSVAAEASSAGESLFGEAGSYAAAASQSVVSAAGGEVKPTDLVGTASSIVSQATAAVVSGASDASEQASSFYESLSSATRSEKKQQGHSVQPEGVAESAYAAVGKQAEAALEKLRAANAREERRKARGVRSSEEL
ncbi:hypothetical protein IE81DRAFT_362020, partial [Ceraceosorus guamensis]